VTRRRYTDNERAAALTALAANGGNVERTARELGIPRKTLAQWARGQRHPEAAQMSHEKKALLADIYEEIAYRSLGHITPAKLKKCDVLKLVKIAAIATDKMLLLRGQAPSSTPAATLTDDERIARLRALEARVRARLAAEADARGEGGARPHGPAAPAALPAGATIGSLAQAGRPRPLEEALAATPRLDRALGQPPHEKT
jgi:transposase-like protein